MHSTHYDPTPIPPPDMTDVIAMLLIPTCAVLMGYGFWLIWHNHKLKRETKRKAEAVRQQRIYLERL